MPRDTGLAQRIREQGVEVVEVAGWQTRGNTDFAPYGAVNHHTAGSALGAAPSLAICTYGRSDLPGPLCHVLLGRDLKAYVIAAGRANHAGTGGWAGLSGNRRVHGLEIEHVGTGTSPNQVKVAVRIHAAFLKAPGSSNNAAYVCQHFEWAPTRKIDFRELSPWSANSFRTDIASVLRNDPVPKPTVSTTEDPTMQFLVKGDATPYYYMTDGATKRQVEGYVASDRAVDSLLKTQNEINVIRARQSWAPIQIVAAKDKIIKEDGKRHWEPFVWSQGAIDDLPTTN